ncbi:hypothetical protein ACIHFD_49385 [Nonomuraea sp. NPDC051941]|uniref:hypothetical protein n=1 Tax=Nonomuraea sp. NPDC051941 TaxID=3364373 RepID=UPI0037C60EB9
MIIPKRTDICIPAGHQFRVCSDHTSRPPRPIGLQCTCCESWWPLRISSVEVVFNDQPRVGHTPDERRPDHTRCGRPLTPGTWTTEEGTDLGCGGCMALPASGQPAEQGQLDLWADLD